MARRCPSQAQLGRILVTICKAQASAKGSANIYVIAPDTRSLQDLGMADTRSMWKSAALEGNWSTIVKDARTMGQPLEMDKPGSEALTVSRTPVAIIAISRTGG